MIKMTSITRTILYGLIFLLFFQLVSDFVENIYTFGLLGTDIPPQIVCVLLFLSPLVLLFFRRGLPRQAAWILALGAALARSIEVASGSSTRMIASGLGVGFLLILFPTWFSQARDDEAGNASLEAGTGLLAALAVSILLRVAGEGTDLSLLYPWISWALAALLVFTVIVYERENRTIQPDVKPNQPSSSSGITSGLGFMACLSVLYFGFASPLVLARWSGVDDRLVVGLLALSLTIAAVSLAAGWPRRISWAAIAGWNGLFLASGTIAILVNQVSFAAESSAYPIGQPALVLVQQIPLLVMILLSPIVAVNLSLFSRKLSIHKSSPRRLAAGFLLGAFFLMLIVFMQVFTTVYDYIPVAGPWFRDRFWLVFLLAGLGMVLPILATRKGITLDQLPLHRVFSPIVIILVLLTLGLDLASQPEVTTPVGSKNLRVATYNIQQGYSADGQRNYQGQLEVLRSLDADVIGLEESDTARFSGGNGDVVRTIANGLNMYSYYGPRTVTGTFGIALLSRYPLESPHTFFMYSSGEQTAAIEAQITVNNHKYTILVTHLGNGGPMIQQQQVLADLAGKDNVIAMGDFNFRPSSAQYELTLQTLEDAWAQVGSPLPKSLDAADLIDHFFVSNGMAVQSVKYVDSPASDHPAVVMEITP